MTTVKDTAWSIEFASFWVPQLLRFTRDLARTRKAAPLERGLGARQIENTRTV